MRVVVGSALIMRAGATLSNIPAPATTLVFLCLAVSGLLLIPGLWTPIAGSLVALIEIYRVITQPGDRWEHLLMGTIAGALAMLGPGMWSVDARVFGWKRVEGPPRPK